MKKDRLIYSCVCIFVLLMVFHPINGIWRVAGATSEDGDGVTEYWGVLIGVEYKWFMDVLQIQFWMNVDRMYDLLLVSDLWQEDHIIKLTNEDASLVNIIAAFEWLDDMDDGDDFCFIYYTAHGFNLSVDLPPFDEEDGRDEFLTTYWTGFNPFAVITDDYFNALLSDLDASGVAVLLDACHSGGMIDDAQDLNLSYWMLAPCEQVGFYSFGASEQEQNEVMRRDDISMHGIPFKTEDWLTGFSEELYDDGRVIMTNCAEHENGSGISFGRYIMQALQGYGDLVVEGGNDNGIVSAEEAFAYAEPRWSHDDLHPIIYDGYPGELELTDDDFPPDTPLWVDCPVLAEINTVYPYTVVCSDPEDHDVCYGFDWHEPIHYIWEIEADEWSPGTPSDMPQSINHIWEESGIYRTHVCAQDIFGAEHVFPEDRWSHEWTTIVASDDEIVDQYHPYSQRSKRFNHTRWLAQSFTPTMSSLSKLTLELTVRTDPETTIEVYILDELEGDILTMCTQEVDHWSLGGGHWIEFSLDDISLTPDEEYFMVIMSHYTGSSYGITWSLSDDIDRYPGGQGYISYDAGDSWQMLDADVDFCFVEYAESDDSDSQPLI